MRFIFTFLCKILQVKQKMNQPPSAKGKTLKFASVT